MTNEYKENILNYLTGNLENDSGYNEPIFTYTDIYINNLKLNLSDYFQSMVFYRAFVPSKDNKNQNLEYSVLACYGTLVGESDESGAFVILDKNYEIVQVITEYKDGTKVGIVQALNVDDSGNFYAVELRGTTYRIVELNNLVLRLDNQDEYEAVIKNTYTIPTTYKWDSITKVYRNTGKNKYFILGTRDNNSVYTLLGAELTISNNQTWAYYTSNYSWSNVTSIFNNGVEVYWDSNNNLQFQIAVFYYGLFILSKGTGTAMVSTQYTSDSSYGNTYNNLIFYSNEIAYYVVIDDNETYNTYHLYKINLSTKQVTEIYTEQSNYYQLNNQMWLFKSNNTIYFYKVMSISNQDEYGDTQFMLDFGIIDDTTIFTQTLGTYYGSSFTTIFCYANMINKFNKNYLYIQNQNKVYIAEFNWNVNNYNGNSFINQDSLIPSSVAIEDSNENEIYNRNIYNLTNYSNFYTAMAQVPNYSLNEEEIYNAILYSKNNNILLNKNINITKNIYEELNVNFNNQINIINQANNENNISGATRLNNSMLNNDYENTYISKYKINYADNTSVIKNISVNELIYTDLSTNYNIIVYVDKLIDNIELISNDEQTSYNKIDCSSLEIGKYYQINQRVRIE